MSTLLHLFRILALLLIVNNFIMGQCVTPSISLPDASTPVDGNPATAYCVTFMFDPAIAGYPPGMSMLLEHTWQGDLSIFVNACGNTLNVMQRPGAVNNCVGGAVGNGGDIGSFGSPVNVSFSDGGGADPENGIAIGGGSYGITADDGCAVGTPGITTFAALWAACPPGIITAQICIGDHALLDDGVVENLSLNFPGLIVCGCTNPNAPNYNPLANVDDGSCLPCPLMVFATPTQPSCSLNNGSISVSPSGAGYTYAWAPGSVSGSNPSNLAPGTYTVTVTETATGCLGTASVTLNPSTAVAANATPTQPSCGLDNGSISVSPSGAGYTYAWSPGSVSGSNPTNLPPGFYSVTVTQTATGCMDDAAVTLNPSAAITTTATPTQPTCGLNNGSISVSPSGAGYTYTWSPGSVSGSNPTNLPPGFYSVTVTQTATGCTDDAAVTLNPSAAITTTATPTQPTCGLNNGSISVSPSGAGYTYSWSPGSVSGSSPSNLPPGFYSVTVTETATGCTDDATVTLNPSPPLTATANPTQPTCQLNNGAISVSPSGGGYTYTWNPPSVSGSNPTNLAPGNYSVTVTQLATGCTDDVAVTLNPSFSVVANLTATQPTCGLNNGSVSVSPSGPGYTYTWNPASLSGSTASNLAPGTYSVTVTQLDGGCEDIESVTLNPSSPPIANATANPAVICEGQSTQLTATGGGTYAWSTGQNGAMITVSPTSTTTYSVTVTNNGCSATGTVTVTVNQVNATATANPASVCLGSPVQLSATGGGTYSWSTGQSGAVITVNPLATTTYSVTVTNNGCTDVANVTVTVNQANATATANPASVCLGSPVQLSATGGGTYNWSTGQSGAVITVVPNATTTYSVTVTNNGCTDIAGVTVTVNSATATAIADPLTICAGEQTLLAATGGGTYLWSTGQSGANIFVFPSSTTTYSVTVTNNGCTDVANATVTVTPVNTQVTANPALVCEGAATVLTATGGGTYSWSTGHSAPSINVFPAATTTYSVTATNNGCTDVANVTVTVNSPTATAAANPALACSGTPVQLSATGGGTYTWSTGQSGAVITVVPVATTTYSVTVTNNGCTDVANVTVTVGTVSATAVADPLIVCPGGSALLTAGGGGTYLWSTGQSGASVVVFPLATTNYTVTVTNNGCSAVANTTVSLAAVNGQATASPASVCQGASSVLTATGGGTYNWSTGQTGASISVSPTTTTTYTVTVTNNGCTDVETVTVNVNSVVATATAAPSAVCPGLSATLTATGGGTYLWSTGQTGASIAVAPTATTTYSVTVTNNGCTDVATVTVNLNSIVATATASPSAICPGLSATLTATGGGTYLWSTGQSGSSISVAPATTTTYSVTVTNNGCTDVAQVTVSVSGVLTPLVTALPATICPGQSSVLTASGGNTYSWSTGQSGASITVNPSSTTTYMVTATNNGCAGFASITVIVDANLPVTATASPGTLCAGQSTTLTATGGGTYSWSTGQSGASISVAPSATTTFSVTATNNGCTGTANVTVTVNPIPVPTAVASPATICAGQSAILTATGGSAYQWSGSLSGAAVSVVPASTTAYTVTVTANGCTATTGVTVVVNPVPVPVAIATPDTICAGQTANLVATGGGIYAWNGGQSGSAISVVPNSTTTYTVTVTNNGCTATASTTVTVIPLPAVTAVANPGVICAGETALLMAGGGSTYSWNTGQTDANFTVSPLDTTTYTVTASSNGCAATASVTLFVNTVTATATAGLTTICPGLTTDLTATGGGTYLWSTGATDAVIAVSPATATTYSVTVTGNGCTDVAAVTVSVSSDLVPGVAASPAVVCPGQASTLTASGGSIYSWSTGASDSSIVVTPLATTTYFVTASENGCTGSASITVTVDTTLNATASASPDTICAGQSAMLTAAGGSAYLWSGGQADASIPVTPSNTTTYQVTVTNNGCTGTAEITVAVLPLPTPTVVAASDTLCVGESTILTVSGGATYLWEDGQTGASITVTPLATTTYTVIANEVGCTDTGMVTVIVHPLPIPVATAAPDSICPGQSATLTATGGDTYQWSNGESGATIVVTPVASTTYSVTATSNGCQDTAEVTVTVNPLPVVVATADPATLCIGQSTTLTASGGQTYAWSGGQTGAAIVVTPLTTTTYTVTATDGNGCQASTTVTVTVNPLPIPTINATSSIICAGDTAILTADGGTTYLWSTGDTTATISVAPLNTAIYSVTVTNLGCTASASATILVNPLPVAIASPDTICAGESAVLTVSGGDLYQWSTGQTGSEITIAPAVTTTYTVTVIEEGCLATVPVTVTVHPLPVPVAFAVPPVICRGDTGTLQVSGGATFVWSTGDTGASINVAPLATTVYAVTATENGCVGTTETTLLVSQPPFAVVAPTVAVCNGPGGPFTLDFSTLITGGDTGGIWSDIQNSGATGAYPALDFTGVTPGNYLFRYTTQSAEAPCEEVVYEVNVEVVFCDCPSVATLAGGPLCNADGTLDLAALVQTNEPGAWSLVGVPAGNLPAVLENGIFNAENADAGIYELRFTLLESPPSGCPEFSTQLIAVEAAVSAGIPTENWHICFGTNEAVNLFELLDGESAGGQWAETSSIPSTGGAFQASVGSFDVTTQQPANYRFRYRIAPGGVCPSEESFVEVEIEPLPIARAGMDQALDCVRTDVVLDGSGSGSGANVLYLWTTDDGNILSGAGSLSPLVDAAGNYLLSVTDQSYGCSATDTVSVIANNIPPETALIVAEDPLCHNQINGAISVVSVTGGSAPYLYSINQQPFTIDPNFDGLSEGTYAVEIEDANGCRWATEVVLNNPPVVEVTAGSDVTIFYGDSTRLIAGVLPLEAAYSFIWTPTNGLLCDTCEQVIASPDTTTIYQVMAVNANGCQDSDEVRVTVQIKRDVFVPNGFSPNNDGVNDILMVYASESVEKVLEFDIYSRWGESVFYAANFPPNDPFYGWNGVFRKKPAPLDVYVYYVRVRYKDGTEKLFKGDALLAK